MKKYMTRQRKELFLFFEHNKDGQYSVETIAAKLSKSGDISISSIYRNVEKLVEEGLVKRFMDNENRVSLYQYIGDNGCDEHLHLKCKKCGCVIHSDKEETEKIHNLFLTENEFDIDEKDIMLYGTCKNCKYNSESN